MKNLLHNVLNLLVVWRSKIISGFTVLYLLMGVLLLVAYAVAKNMPDFIPLLYSLGKKFGELSVIVYVMTLIPGICERFRCTFKIISILRIYRRYLGILMYFFAIAHVLLLKVFSNTAIKDMLPQFTFELMGSVSLLLLFLPLATSNNFSMAKLKIGWYRIQRLTYVAMFFVLLHVALLGASSWSALLLLVAALQLFSFAFSFWKIHSLTGGKPV